MHYCIVILNFELRLLLCSIAENHKYSQETYKVIEQGEIAPPPTKKRVILEENIDFPRILDILPTD